MKAIVLAAWAFLYYGHTNVSVLDGGQGEG